MNRYAIYCTGEQTERAYVLGAPVRNVANCGVPSDAPMMEIERCDYYVPTAEEMCGWLRQEHNLEISIVPLCKDLNRDKLTADAYQYSVCAYGSEYASGEVSGNDMYAWAVRRAIDASLDLLESTDDDFDLCDFDDENEE